jgi:phosphatidylinositol-3-phosphatase
MNGQKSNLIRANLQAKFLCLLAAVLLPLAMAGCGAGTPGSTMLPQSSSVSPEAATATSQVQQSHHVVMVIEENRSYSSVVGNSTAWPNLNHLIRKGALATHYYANVHPSIGNYFMLTTGKVLTTNDNSRKVWDVPNIARRMLASGVSFKIYAESIPRAGYVGGDTGLYFVRHNPFALLSDLAYNSKLAAEHIVPFSQFATDVRRGALPKFSFIVPNVDDDAHSSSSLRADYWLQDKVVDPLSRTSTFEPGGNGLLIVDFDEAADGDKAHGGGHVAPVLWGPQVKAGYRQSTSTVYQHQSMLRTVMTALRLSQPPGAAASAPLMSEFFK